jgi:hypothetical protein
MSRHRAIILPRRVVVKYYFIEIKNGGFRLARPPLLNRCYLKDCHAVSSLRTSVY